MFDVYLQNDKEILQRPKGGHCCKMQTICVKSKSEIFCGFKLTKSIYK